MTDRAFEPTSADDPFAARLAAANHQADEIEANDPFAARLQARGIEVQPATSVTGAFARGAVRGAAPAVGALPAIGMGAELGAELGTPFGPIGAGAGGIVGGIAGGLLGSTAISAGQDWLIHKLPESAQEMLGMSDRQQQLDEKYHKYSSMVGGFVPFVLAAKPGFALRGELPPNATAIQRIAANPVTAHVLGGGVMGGMEAGQEIAHGEAPDWAKIAIATGFGVVFSQPTGIGQSLTRLGARPVLRLVGREEPSAPGAAPTPSPEVPAAAVPPSTAAAAEAPPPVPAPPVTAADFRREITERDRLGRPYPPTVADAADTKVMGPGITEAVFHGSEQMSPAAEDSARRAKQTEQSVIGPEQPEDARTAAVRMHPDLFARLDYLQRQQAEFAGSDSASAKAHLDTVNKQLDALYPQIQAANRRAAEAIGAQTVEPEPLPPTPLTTEEQRTTIVKDVERQLIAAGRPKEEAKAGAEVIGARYVTRAGWFKGLLGSALDLYNRQGAEILGPYARSQQILPPSPPRPVNEEKLSLLQFLAHRGGLKETPDLVALLDKNPTVPRFGKLFREGGMSLDKAVEEATAAGYIMPEEGIRGVGTEKQLFNAIAEERRGRKVYRPGQEPLAGAEEHPLGPEPPLEGGDEVEPSTERSPFMTEEDESVLLQAQRQTETPEFKQWFGDSKVVDEEGEPLIVFHGTTGSFDKFESQRPTTVYYVDGKEVARADSWDYGPNADQLPEAYHYGALSDAHTMGSNLALRMREKEFSNFPDLLPSSQRHLADLRRLAGKKVETRTETRPTGNAFYFTPMKWYSFIRDIGQHEGGNVMPVFLSIKNPVYLNSAQIESAGRDFRVAEYKKQGYDGAIFANDPKDLQKEGYNGATQIVAFEPEQIKSAIGNRGTFDPNDPRILYQKTQAPPFYSAVERTVTSSKQEKASPSQWLGMLKNMPGVKPEEMEWLGLEDWLKEQKGSVTKQEIADYVRANQIEVKEVTHGAPADESLTRAHQEAQARLEAYNAEITQEYGQHWQSLGTHIDDTTRAEFNRLRDERNAARAAEEAASPKTKFASYQLPGGENYRELLLTLPPSTKQIPFEEWYRQTHVSDFESLSPAAQEVARRQYEREGQKVVNQDNFRSSHFDEPNILAHVRFNDRTIDGKRTLFVEEVQSDWHQKGKKGGYQDTEKQNELERKLYSLSREYDENNKAIQDLEYPGNNEQELKEIEQRKARRRELVAELNALDLEKRKLTQQAVPDAPFKTTWPELAFKRIIRWAAEHGDSEALKEVSQPQSVRELTEQFFGSKTASVMALPASDAAVLPLLQHDQIRQAVIARIPVDVVNLLSSLVTTPERLLSDPTMLSSRRFDVARGDISLALANAISETGAELRTKLLAARTAGRDELLLPALRTSDLSAREVVGMLAPQTIYHEGTALPAGGKGTTAARAELAPTAGEVAGKAPKGLPADGADFLRSPLVAGDGTVSTVSAAGAKAEGAPATIANLLDWHNQLIANSGRGKQDYSAGYSKIAWTTGETQAARYDLSKHVKKLQLQEDPSGKTVTLTAWDHQGRRAIEQEQIKPEQLPDYIGKEAAEKLLAQEPKEDLHRADRYSGRTVLSKTRTLEGLDLKVGGEGMKGFYDQILPATVNKLVKKFGGKVGKDEIEIPKPSGPLSDQYRIEQHGNEFWLVNTAEMRTEGRYASRNEATLAQGELTRKQRAAEPDRQPVHSLDITDKLQEAATEQGFPLFQPARGSLKLNPQNIPGRDFLGAEDVKPILRLTKDANASTFIHESGHQFLAELLRDAEHEAAPEQLKADAKTTLKWLGVEKPEDIAVRHHEKFARGFEQYLREGTAPSPGLARVFAQFRQWLLAIYQTIKGLGQPINEDIRRVFDRLLAEEPQRTVIAAEREAPRGLADEAETDLKEIPPAEKEAAAARVAHERGRGYDELPDDIRTELENEHADFLARHEPTSEPGGEAGQGEVRPGPLQPAGQQQESVPGGGRGGAAPGPQRTGRTQAPSGGNRVSGLGPAGEGPGGERSHLGDLPLAPHAAADFARTDTFNVGKDGNIRTENITSIGQFQRAIEEAKDRIGGSTGPMTDGEVLDAANAMGFTPDELTLDKLVKAFGGVADLNKKVLAFRMAIRDQSERVGDLMARIRDTNDDALVAEYGKERERFDMMMSVLSSVTTEWGRAGRSFRNLEDWDRVQNMAEFLKERSGRTLFQLKMEAKLGAQLDTPAKVSRYLRDAQKRSFGGMLLEYFINNLISGPATHITYLIGNQITKFMEAVPETLVASAIGQARTAFGRPGEYVRPGEALEQIKAIGRNIPKSIQGAVEATRTGQPTLLPGQLARPLNPFFGDTTLTIAKNIQNGPVTWREAMGDLWSFTKGIKDGIVGAAQLVAAGGHAGAPLAGFHYSPLGQIPDVAFRGVPVFPIGSAVRLPGRLISAIHSLDTISNYERFIGARAYREGAELGKDGNDLATHIANRTANPPADWMEDGHKQAYASTLMAPGGNFMRNLSQFVNTVIDLPIIGQISPLKFIDPFVHISGNVLRKTIIERTPVGILSPEIRADLMGKNGNVAADTAAARMLVGSSLAIAYGMLAGEGYISGSGPEDRNKAAMWRLAGNQPHSVRIGDIWYQANRLGPMGMHLSIAADLYDVAHDAVKGDFLTAAAHLQHAVTQNILDESFMRGPSDLIKAVDDPGRYGEGYLKNIASDFLPFSVGMAQMARAMDPYTRQARTVVDELKRKTPGMSETLFPRRDIWGEPIQSPDALGMAGVTAIYESKISRDPVNQAMLQLGIAPAPVERKIRNQDLTDQQYDDFARIAGRLAKERLDKIVNSPDWQRWTPAQRHDVIAIQIKATREQARGMLMAKYPNIPRDAVDQTRQRRTAEPEPIH